jgi:hypothetical protein
MSLRNIRDGSIRRDTERCDSQTGCAGIEISELCRKIRRHEASNLRRVRELKSRIYRVYKLIGLDLLSAGKRRLPKRLRGHCMFRSRPIRCGRAISGATRWQTGDGSAPSTWVTNSTVK